MLSARILGGGATAASIAFALSTAGTSRIEFVVRDAARAAHAVDVAEAAGVSASVRLFEEPLLDRVDLLVSTVPAAAVSGQAHEFVDAAHAVFDVVYDPWPSVLATAADGADLPFVSGLDLLAHQAALQVELMTGESIPPQLLRDAALRELASR